jgi:PAS domain S-box-containing protein
MPDKTTQQKAAEAEVDGFRKKLGPFVVAAETTRMAMVFTDAKDPANPIIFANDSFLKLTGYTREDVLGQKFSTLIAVDSDSAVLERIADAFAGKSLSDSDVCYRRKDGSVFWSVILISPVLNEQGDVVQHFASFVDMSRHKEELAQSHLLIDELNHRVKNTLSTVQSIVWQALRDRADPAEIREAIESRLFALSRSHDLLSRENWKAASLFDVITDAMEPFVNVDGRSARFIAEGPNISFLPKVTLALGIALNELATNAVKYGAFSDDVGSIRAIWTLAADRLILRWEEKNGPLVVPSARKGFGSWVLQHGLAHELDGAVDLAYPATGVVCVMDFPVRANAGRE